MQNTLNMLLIFGLKPWRWYSGQQCQLLLWEPKFEYTKSYFSAAISLQNRPLLWFYPLHPTKVSPDGSVKCVQYSDEKVNLIFWRLFGSASMRMPDQSSSISRKRELERVSPSRAPHSTNVPWCWKKVFSCAVEMQKNCNSLPQS